MVASQTSLTSIIGEFTEKDGDTSAKGAYSETLSAGTVQSMDMTLHEQTSGQSITLRLLVVGGSVYLSGATVLKAFGIAKPWALARADSANSELAKIGQQMQPFIDESGASQFASFVESASTVKVGPQQQVNGIQATRYDVTVDTANAAKTMTGSNKTAMQAAVDAGLKSFPVVVWLDKGHRVVRASDGITFDGETVSFDFEMKSFNTDVKIVAPAAADVFRG